MLPKIFGKIDTYYVLWSAAAVLVYMWTARRAARIYGISRGDVYDVLWWVLFGALVGASLQGYAENWERYYSDPAKLLRFWESPVSSGAGFILGGLLGLWKLRRLGVSVDKFAEASSIPAAFMLATGRLGCFASGCCRGLPTDSPLGVRFPFDPDVPLWPSQLFESAAAVLIGTVLAITEKYRRRESPHAILFPIFLILYGGYRLAFDFLREGRSGLGTGQYAGIVAIVVGIGWLARSVRRGRAVKMS
ncbi:MAG: prolipoprotein diacylglyceryl transferase [Synergistaceae bacterium]|nr:prolipoprotein diacylglyceryl transferase [Synergistaceae bacterium]